jgi:hypothetical protein
MTMGFPTAPQPAPVAPVVLQPAPPAPAPAAPPMPPEMQIAQAGAQLDALTTPPYAGGTPEGSLTSTPRQAAADLLNIGETRKSLEGEEGRIKAGEQSAIADTNQQAAAEKIQQANDYQTALSDALSRGEEDRARHVAAYNDYKAKAGTLKDPETQFYEDRGQGYRVINALAAFAAGIGTGASGGGENPVLKLLHAKMQANYDAHKQNIEDLYNASVESGKIADTDENYQKFKLDAKRVSYDLQSAHIKDELAAIAARAASPLARTAAAKSIAQIDQDQSVVRQNLAMKEAQAAAAKLAAERARQAEVRAAYKDAYDKNLAAGYGDEEARLNATKAVHGLGYNASETAPIFEANGVRTNPTTGEPVFPEPSRGGDQTGEASYNEAGKLVVPTVDAATGKQIKPEERKAIEDEARKRTVIVDGKPQLAVSEEAAKKFAGIQGAVPEAKRLIGVLQKAFNEGDKGTYDQARNQLIEISPVIYGFTRGPSAAQAGEGKEGEGTIAGQIPEFDPTLLGRFSKTIAAFNNTHPIGANTAAAVAQQKLAGLGTAIDRIAADAHQQAFGGKTEAPPSTKSVADLAASFGGKPVTR